MLFPNGQDIQHYIKYKKHTTIQHVKSMIAKVFDLYADSLIDSFHKETGNSVFEIDTYEHRDNVDGQVMIRINFFHDTRVHVYRGIQAQHIHALHKNLWSCLDKQAQFTIEADHNTPA